MTTLSAADLNASPTKPIPPLRIYGWLDTQLSIARHYGGITYNGAEYVIAHNEEGQPLVRVDVLKREAKEARKQRAMQRQSRELWTAGE